MAIGKPLGNFGFKLVIPRNDVDEDTIPVVNEFHIIDEPHIKEGTWPGTFNDIKVQYCRRVHVFYTKGRITQEVFEALRKGKPFGRITQDAIEYIHPGKPFGRITQNVIEYIHPGWPYCRITHALREVLREGEPGARITHALREVLREAVYTYCWGHDTGVTEDNVADLSEGSGTAQILSSGDAECLCIRSGENWVLPSKMTGAVEIELTYDQYETGSGSGSIDYRTGTTQAACEAASWSSYTGHFTSLGWAQIKLSVV